MNNGRKKYLKKVGLDKFCESQKALGNLLEKKLTTSKLVREEANKLFAEKNKGKNVYRKLLSLYNKSIALAPNDSEELAFGYNNRSILLKHLKKYEESLFDINRVLQITNSEELKAKLEIRNMKCVKMIEGGTVKKPKTDQNAKEYRAEALLSKFKMNDPKASKQGIGKQSELPKMIYSKIIPSIADSITIKYNATKGRSMVATKDIRPGEAVAIEKAYVVYPSEHQQYTICNHCLGLAWNGLPCDTCACVIYCSEDCKKTSWTEYHKIECAILPFMCGKVFENTNMERILISTRCFVKAVMADGIINVMNDVETIDNDKDVSIEKLSTKKNSCYGKFVFIYKLTNYNNNSTDIKINDDDMFIFSTILSLLNKYTNIFVDFKLCKNSEDLKLLVKKVLLKLKNFLDNNINYFQLNTKDVRCDCKFIEYCLKNCNRYLGFIFAPVCSFFHHSCIPNVDKLLTIGNKVLVFTLQPVKKGDKLYLSYGLPLTHDKETRQKHLRKHFKTKNCECQACDKNWPILSIDTSFQSLLLKGVRSDLKKMCMYENISCRSIFNLNYNSYNMKILEDNKRIVEEIYNTNEEDPITANQLSHMYKFFIATAFIKFYSKNFQVSNNC